MPSDPPCADLPPPSLADLKGKYPALFPRAAPSGGPGWYALLDELCAALQARTAGTSPAPAVFLRAREKWGRLGLRLHPYNAEDAPLLAYVEALSMRVCEVCAAPGELIAEAWHRTRCTAHRDTRPTWATDHRQP